jgi:hypothetical protein
MHHRLAAAEVEHAAAVGKLFSEGWCQTRSFQSAAAQGSMTVWDNGWGIGAPSSTARDKISSPSLILEVMDVCTTGLMRDSPAPRDGVAER